MNATNDVRTLAGVPVACEEPSPRYAAEAGTDSATARRAEVTAI